MIISLIRLAHRFVSGRPMDGRRRTNASFTTPATVAVRAGGASWWSCLPGWQRSAARIAAVFGMPFGLCCFCAYPKTTAFFGTAAAIAVTVYLINVSAANGRDAAHYRNVVWPLHHTLTQVLKINPANPDTWLTVPKDYRTNPSARVRVRVPLNNALSSTTQRAVETAVRNKLGIADWQATWRTTGSHPSVVFTPLSPIPDSVDMIDFAPYAISSTKKSEVTIGVSRGGRIATIDLAGESPHILIAGETGCGKSALALWISVQILLKGGRIIICDIKGSHRWARNLPGIQYYRSIEQIHDALTWVSSESARRNDAAWDSVSSKDFQRIVLLFEEASSTLPLLKNYWNTIREKEDPKASPAIQGYVSVMAMGRSACVNVLLLAQSANAQATGGAGTRENFGLRMLGRCTANQVAMLTGIRNGPKCSRHPGRWMMFIGGKFLDVQVPFAGKDESPATRARIARLLGSVSRPTQDPDQGRGVGRETRVRPETGRAEAPAEPVAEPEEPTSEPLPIGLREAVETGLLGDVKLSAARKRISRAAGKGPRVVSVSVVGEKMYDAAELREWFCIR